MDISDFKKFYKEIETIHNMLSIMRWFVIEPKVIFHETWLRDNAYVWYLLVFDSYIKRFKIKQSFTLFLERISLIPNWTAYFYVSNHSSDSFPDYLLLHGYLFFLSKIFSKSEDKICWIKNFFVIQFNYN